MPGYLDQYGAGEEERNRIIIRSIVAVIVAVVLGSLSWYLLKNHHQEGVVKTFLGEVRRGNYQTAYRDWGCTEANHSTSSKEGSKAARNETVRSFADFI